MLPAAARDEQKDRAITPPATKIRVLIFDGVEVLGRRDQEPVIVRQGRIVASTFHPELARDDRLHRLVLASGEAEDV